MKVLMKKSNDVHRGRSREQQKNTVNTPQKRDCKDVGWRTITYARTAKH